MSNLNYNPKPLDTSQFKLSDDVLRLTELLAENTHDVWARERMSQGWVFGPKRDDEKRQHPCLIPYRDLPEEEKQYDRNAALETLKTVLSLGYPKPNATNAAVTETTFLHGVDPDEKNKRIIGQLKKPKLTVAELRRLWEERLPLVWFRNVEIYRRAVDSALRLGESFLAFDIAVEGLNTFNADLRLIQLQALALARTGATRRANEILGQLRTSGHQDEETLGILARTHKDFWLLSADPKEKEHHLRLSFELYADAYRRNRGYYSGINAASIGLICGEKDAAHQFGKEVFEMCTSALEKLAPDSDERYWIEATLAEAALVRGDLPMAEHYYRHASEFGGQSSVVLSRTRSQARLLSEHASGDPHRMDACFKLPRIVVFSGHMFDRLDRATPRFPLYLEKPVKEEIRQRLAKMEAQVGFSSLACGGDILFSEALLERGGEVNIVLPFRKEDFKACSVDIIQGINWNDRFEKILENAATVTILNEHGTGNDGAAFEYCNQAINGLALLKGQFLGMDVLPLAVWDGALGGRGGTQSFVEFWEQRNNPVEVIPLAEMLARVPRIATPVPEVEPQPVIAPELAAMQGGEPNPAQDIKAMLFADIVGFTKLTEMQVPSFVARFLGRVASLMQQMSRPPIHQNTWGDAVCCVFDHVSDAGTFALNLRDLVRGTDWTNYGLPRELNIRIALHAGPVFACYDPILKKMTYNGSHVNRTARIEPVAEEGQIYASNAFAALATAEGVKDFVCDYVGLKQLAKKYGAIPVFLVRRKL
jgi:class 3 adenylate cyclase